MNKVLILISRPNSLTNKDGVVSFLFDYNEYVDKLSVIRENLLVGQAWDFRSPLLPENFADVRINLYWQREEMQEDVTIMFRGRHYELFNTEFYK